MKKCLLRQSVAHAPGTLFTNNALPQNTGTYFQASWLKTYEQSEKTGFPYGMEHGDLNIYGASDYAVTEGRENYTVHIIVGLDHNSNIYVLNLWRRQNNI